jgi:hypothetical protein
MWNFHVYVVHLRGIIYGPFVYDYLVWGYMQWVLRNAGRGNSNIIIVRCEYEQDK